MTLRNFTVVSSSRDMPTLVGPLLDVLFSFSDFCLFLNVMIGGGLHTGGGGGGGGGGKEGAAGTLGVTRGARGADIVFDV